MSESIEIVEISDGSINIDALSELKDESTTEPVLDTTTKTKRQLNESDLDTDENSPKKFRIDESQNEDASEIDSKVTLTITDGQISTIEVPSQSVVDKSQDKDETVKENESSEIQFELNTDVLDIAVMISSSVVNLGEEEEGDADEMLEEVPEQSNELIEEQEEVCEEEDEDELADYQESESGNSSENEEDDDDAMMKRAVAATIQHNQQSAKKSFQMPTNDEPIALDDSDDDIPQETSEYHSDGEFSVDNNVIGGSDESDGEEEFNMLREKAMKSALKPHVLQAQRLVKKSLRFLTRKRVERKKILKNVQVEKEKENEVKNPLEEKNKCENPKILSSDEHENANELNEEKDSKTQPDKPQEMEVDEPLKIETEPLNEKESTEGEELKKATDITKETSLQPEKSEENVEEPQGVNQVTENSNESSNQESNLLHEIANSSIDDIFNRYVIKNSDQTPTLDEFKEELFFCLHQNKQEIEKAQQLWNEKVHIKYKIRELMEKIRRHKAVMEIEAFGEKPENVGGNNSSSNNNNNNSSSHPIISSKSSTTTNSEADNYEKHFRMSSESVSRLIQDVRASMLRRDEKQRHDDLVSASNTYESNQLSSQWNNLQGNGNGQGRQGQIVDVQSIINDFRQKNPQEIPRRGRRMKSSFGSGFFDNQSSDRNEFLANASNNNHDFNNTMKSNSGYPEVSLHPVQNLYKNLSNVAGPSGAHLSGQKSSLLQSILTKQSTKSPVGFHPNHSALPSTSTLARLLTAPERSFQGAPTKQTSQSMTRQSSGKVHHNGEITITPIGANNSRNKDFSMEDEDNSLEPPLVIDETEDFDASERSNVKSVSDLLCQGCKKNKAFFMCAGCSRQWYCSKECQEMAWDEHAESCMI